MAKSVINLKLWSGSEYGNLILSTVNDNKARCIFNDDSLYFVDFLLINFVKESVTNYFLLNSRKEFLYFVYDETCLSHHFFQFISRYLGEYNAYFISVYFA